MDKPEKLDKYYKSNKELWNNKTEIHVDSKFYDNVSFLNGRNTLNEIELEYLQDIKGKSVLHIQCHFGQDSISMARMGAKVTATDISNVALDYARKFNEELGTDVTFIETATYDILNHIDQQFDLIFMSYGVIPWLPDMQRLSDCVNALLKKGGRMLMVEFHPMFWTFDHDKNSIEFSYNNVHVYEEDAEFSYVDSKTPIKGKEYFWQHSFEEVMTPYINHGMRLTAMREYYYSPYDVFDCMKEIEKGKYRFGDFPYPIPHVYLLEYTK